MKTKIITIVLMLLAGSMLTSCDRSKANEAITPPGPDRVTVLEKQVEAERKLREQAEVRAAGEASDTEMWQLAALGLVTLTLLAFFGGTALGSRGRHHAAIS